MKILKNFLSFIVVLQLILMITLLTNYSIAKLNCINNCMQIFSISKISYKKDITLAQIVEEKKHTRAIVSAMVNNQPNHYLPLSQIKRDSVLAVDKIEADAKHLLGRRYVWGATGPKCFDCSGFTQKIYHLSGVNLPRVSREQAKVGALVKFEHLQRGDMVFFDTERKPTGRVNHVGIYLEDGKFIHASSGNKKVVITSFNKKKFYKNRFLWGRRILKSNNRVVNSLPSLNINTLMASR